jgi:hypothetical protein
VNIIVSYEASYAFLTDMLLSERRNLLKHNNRFI